MKIINYLIVIACSVAGASCGWLSEIATPEPVKREIFIQARQYSYEPEVIKANRGDTLVFTFISLDVVHGFYLEGYDIDVEIYPHLKTVKFRHPSQGFNWKDTSSVMIITNRVGKSRYRCSHTCGNMHPFMQGEIIVSPNIQLWASIGGIIGFFTGMLIMFYLRVRRASAKGRMKTDTPVQRN